MTRVTRDPI